MNPVTEEKKSFPPRKPARLTTVRELSPETKGPVRVLGIVVEAKTGAALVQGVMDEVGHAATIPVIVEGDLQVAEKYMLIGEVTEKKTSKGKELQLEAKIAHNVDELDIKEFKQALDLEKKVLDYLRR
ncbi:hypothetical protein EU545_01140 [Candidatus Thorarchaeota archaeon]|nr:MAG: hypothetical protein EU545_01140 [Candidatus Thorarchaeota archaeon]